METYKKLVEQYMSPRFQKAGFRKIPRSANRYETAEALALSSNERRKAFRFYYKACWHRYVVMRWQQREALDEEVVDRLFFDPLADWQNDHTDIDLAHEVLRWAGKAKLEKVNQMLRRKYRRGQGYTFQKKNTGVTP